MAPERMRNGCPSSRKSLSPMVKDEPFAGAGSPSRISALHAAGRQTGLPVALQEEEGDDQREDGDERAGDDRREQCLRAAAGSGSCLQLSETHGDRVKLRGVE